MEIMFSFLVLIMFGIGIAGLVFWIWALIQVIKRPNDSDYQAGSQIVWILCLIFLNLLGAILYLILGHRREV